jgi:hypothetical protein
VTSESYFTFSGSCGGDDSDCEFCASHGSLRKTEHNVVKMRPSASNWNMPAGRVRSKINANDEILEGSSRSIGDLLLPVSPLTRRVSNMSADHHVLYSFDRAETPGKPLSLEVFVKPATSRETEKFVEKEYEILDANGEALKGRKARKHLRQTAAAPATDSSASGSGAVEVVEEDDGFELV